MIGHDYSGVPPALAGRGRCPAGFANRSALRALTPLRVPHAIGGKFVSLYLKIEVIGVGSDALPLVQAADIGHFFAAEFKIEDVAVLVNALLIG